MAPQLEEFIRVQLPQLVLQYIANECEMEVSDLRESMEAARTVK